MEQMFCYVIPYIAPLLLRWAFDGCFYFAAGLFFSQGAGRLLHETARPFQTSNFWVLFILRHELISSGAVGREWRAGWRVAFCIVASNKGHSGCSQMALCSVEISALPHIMQAEPTGSRCMEECTRKRSYARPAAHSCSKVQDVIVRPW